MTAPEPDTRHLILWGCCAFCNEVVPDISPGTVCVDRRLRVETGEDVGERISRPKATALLARNMVEAHADHYPPHFDADPLARMAWGFSLGEAWARGVVRSGEARRRVANALQTMEGWPSLTNDDRAQAIVNAVLGEGSTYSDGEEDTHG